MKKLIIAEKPSVAKNIADATASSRKNGYFEGEYYVITWAFGHLLQLYDARDYDPEMRSWKIEKFPYIPEKFLYKIKSDGKNKEKPDSGVVQQMNTIKNLMERKDVEGIISATDDDREGQIIADEIITPEIREDTQFNYNKEKLSEKSFHEMICIVNEILNENLIKAISHLNYLNRHITDGSNMENKIQIKLAVEEIEKIKQKISLIKQQLNVFKNFEV